MHAKCISQQGLTLDEIGQHFFCLIGKHSVRFNCIELSIGFRTECCGAGADVLEGSVDCEVDVLEIDGEMLIRDHEHDHLC